MFTKKQEKIGYNYTFFNLTEQTVFKHSNLVAPL